MSAHQLRFCHDGDSNVREPGILGCRRSISHRGVLALGTAGSTPAVLAITETTCIAHISEVENIEEYRDIERQVRQNAIGLGIPEIRNKSDQLLLSRRQSVGKIKKNLLAFRDKKEDT